MNDKLCQQKNCRLPNSGLTCISLFDDSHDSKTLKILFGSTQTTSMRIEKKHKSHNNVFRSLFQNDNIVDLFYVTPRDGRWDVLSVWRASTY